ncbi:MAG: glycosyltransferase [Bacteroidota bacterium]|nr:glycosyltransferase [Bacteroidota bacterium]
MKFIFLGNMSFKGFPQREHAFAIGLAERGYDVTFIEGMPSFGSRLTELVTGKWKRELSLNLPKSLRVLTPPIIPTMFRSSYTPAIDRIIFQRWWKKQFNNYNWNDTVGIVTFPYWWFGFVDRKLFPVGKLIYDSCDSLIVPSRTPRALERMKLAETNILNDADAVTYSAHAMKGLYFGDNSFCITNGIHNDFLLKNSIEVEKRNTISIGYIGSLDSRWIDIKLILYIAEKINNCVIHLFGPMNNDLIKRTKKYPNIISHGFIQHKNIPEIFKKIDVAIIPFLHNKITDLVNPLKLFEYCSMGIPIVAIRTMELEHYQDIIYLAETKEQFIQQIQQAFLKNSEIKIQQRISFATLHTWDKKVDQLIHVIKSI